MGWDQCHLDQHATYRQSTTRLPARSGVFECRLLLYLNVAEVLCSSHEIYARHIRYAGEWGYDIVTNMRSAIASVTIPYIYGLECQAMIIGGWSGGTSADL